MAALQTFVNSSPSPVKFWFYTDKIVSTEWRNLVPRRRTSDCSEIHFLRWGFCALLLSSHQIFLLVGKRSLIASSARNPRNFGSQAFVAISVFAEVSFNTVLPFLYPPLLKHHHPNLSSLLQRNVRAHASPSPLDYLWRAVTNQECLALDPPLSKIFLCAGSRFPVDLIMFPICWNTLTDPLISMLKTNCCWNMMTVLVRQELRSCPLYK